MDRDPHDTPPNGESRRDAVRRFLLERWAKSARRPARRTIGRLFGRLFPATEGTYAFEYADIDSEQTYCVGPVVAAWRIDAEGVHPVDARPGSVSLGRRGMWYRFQQVGFSIARDGDRLVLSVMAGPRAGHGGLYRIEPHERGFDLVAEGAHWRA